MESHSEKQLLLLKRMGIDVWKQRRPRHEGLEKTPASGRIDDRKNPDGSESPDLAPISTVISAPRSVDNEQADSNAEPGIAHPSTTFVLKEASPEGYVAETTQPEPVSSPAVVTESAEKEARKHGERKSENLSSSNSSRELEVHCQPNADWCFVTAAVGDSPGEEKKLFEAIVFALGLESSDYSLLWIGDEKYLDSQSNPQSAVKESLTSLLEQSRPKIIVIFGGQPARHLIGTDKPISILREEVYRYQGGKSQLVVTFGLSHMLANPSDKALVWSDLQKGR